MLRGKHVMVRVGGGWETLQNYILKHDPGLHFEMPKESDLIPYGSEAVKTNSSTPRSSRPSSANQSLRDRGVLQNDLYNQSIYFRNRENFRKLFHKHKIQS